MKRLVILLLVIFLLPAIGLGQEATPAPKPAASSSPVPGNTGTPSGSDAELQIAVAGSPPFVVPVGKDLEGLSVETWRALAGELGVDYELHHLESMEDLLRGVHDGDYDVGIGPISITSERATFVAFTQPYYDSSLGILSVTESKKKKKVDLNLPELFLGFGFFVGVLAVVGGICWMLEHRANPEQFSDDPRKGIGSGMWMALVTLTTVGYGDKAPVTFAGRVFTGMWMITTMVAVSSFTAWLATTLTVSQLEDSSITDASQLADKRVGVVPGTTSEVFGRHFTSQLVGHPSYVEALESLEREEVDAVVYDYPVLAYHIRNNPDVPLRLAESTFALQDYGFVLSRENPELHRYNVALLRLAESGVLRDIRQHWIQSKSDSIGSEQE